MYVGTYKHVYVCSACTRVRDCFTRVEVVLWCKSGEYPSGGGGQYLALTESIEPCFHQEMSLSMEKSVPYTYKHTFMYIHTCVLYNTYILCVCRQCSSQDFFIERGGGLKLNGGHSGYLFHFTICIKFESDNTVV